jgi:hypothetical protein
MLRMVRLSLTPGNRIDRPWLYVVRHDYSHLC